ncbi:Uncharacterized protein DAT39_021806 [Clarias magur]|uniref:Uncharacterized protein n=1 Tax=Clarias magur TaxID=1594786 RepID=A0A8J4WQG0_CLAMG|nr:Uncharacterized protein DAT39_021806 [Clarias magur]
MAFQQESSDQTGIGTPTNIRPLDTFAFIRLKGVVRKRFVFASESPGTHSNRGPKVKDSDLKGAFGPGSVVRESDDDGSEEMKA